ncbi:MAG: TraR/DksA family transcriptional regulator [Nocardioidaceae bacterium]
MRAGTYGRCEHCGDPIIPGRLQALPATRLCIRCTR